MKPAKTTFGCMCMCLLLEGALVLVGKPQETIPTWLEGFEDSAGVLGESNAALRLAMLWVRLPSCNFGDGSDFPAISN